MKRILVLGLLSALALPASAFAAGIGKGNGEIGFDFAGYTAFDDNVTEEGGGLFSFRGGYHFTDLVELEGEVTASVADDAGADIFLTRIMVNAVFSFRPGPKTVVPYFLVGVGQATLTFDTFFGDVDDSDVAYQGGFGTRFFFGRRDRVALRLEGSVLSEGTFDETSTHWSARVGFTWTLGQGR
jgi:hypothetical protein